MEFLRTVIFSFSRIRRFGRHAVGFKQSMSRREVIALDAPGQEHFDCAPVVVAGLGGMGFILSHEKVQMLFAEIANRIGRESFGEIPEPQTHQVGVILGKLRPLSSFGFG